MKFDFGRVNGLLVAAVWWEGFFLPEKRKRGSFKPSSGLVSVSAVYGIGGTVVEMVGIQERTDNPAGVV